MYKITRIFASDIVAGANILQQACFPIYNPENEAGPLTQSSQDHGVIFAANGTCKTTLISFLLNTFYPDQNRFVQHIQSGGDKTMGQYLVPGRPAIILIEMAVPSEQTLFGEEKEERLVIGQYFISKRGAQKPFDRFNFQAASPDLFNRVKDNWQHLTAAPQPDAAVREFIDPLITIAGTQKEWFEKLEKIGLDPWLINQQINFARNEGGIKDAFRFRAESDFLEFFLGCVTDMTYAEKLRDETLRCMGKIKDRPEKKSRLNAIITLKSHLQNFDRIAGQWRNASKEQVRCRQDLEQASFLAAKALPKAAEQKAQVRKNFEQILARKEKIEKQLQQTGADQFKAREFALGQDEEAYRKKVIELSGSLEKIDRELNALGAADILAQIHMIKERIQVKTNALEESGADLDPLRREVDQKAKKFHISLTQKYKKIEGKIFSSKQRLASTDEDRDSCQMEI